MDAKIYCTDFHGFDDLHFVQKDCTIFIGKDKSAEKILFDMHYFFMSLDFSNIDKIIEKSLIFKKAASDFTLKYESKHKNIAVPKG